MDLLFGELLHLYPSISSCDNAVQAMEKQKNTEIEVKSANVEEGNASAVLTETDGKVVVVDVIFVVVVVVFGKLTE